VWFFQTLVVIVEVGSRKKTDIIVVYLMKPVKEELGDRIPHGQTLPKE
jgi:hypothetical protein